MGQRDVALNYFEKSNLIFKELYEANPNRIEIKENFAFSFYRLGSIHQEFGNMKIALKYHEKRSLLEKKRYESSPEDVKSLEDFGGSYYQLAIFYKQIGNQKLGRSWIQPGLLTRITLTGKEKSD
jgi:tetratricopeptide (TPR) repeat protein